MMNANHSFDVIVAGGGMVGAALAYALADAKFNVALIEFREPFFEWDPGSISNRVSALTRASQNLLEHLGAWPIINSLGATPYQKMHVWNRPGVGEIHFEAADIGEPDLGHIVENRIIQRALWERLKDQQRVQLFCPASITEYRPADVGNRSTVTLEDGRQLQSSLVIAADGARSALRGMAGIGVEVRDFEQSAVVATVRVEAGHRNTAWQRFLPTGPLAFLPVDPVDQCSIVWSTSTADAERLLSLSDDAFRSELGDAVDNRLGSVTETGPRSAFPLRSQLAERTVASGLALVGDAAHVIHPLAGQGVNLGFLDVATLVQVLTDARGAKREPIGHPANLRRYERSRKGETFAVMRAMEAFNGLFSNRSSPLDLIRNLGLRLTDAATPVKNQLIRRAMGLDGEHPPLARPVG